jgi:hypothetical protein
MYLEQSERGFRARLRRRSNRAGSSKRIKPPEPLTDPRFQLALFWSTKGVNVATSGGEFRAGTPKPLFKLPFGYNQEATPWDVRADGNRFLVAVPLQENSRTPFTVVLDWPAGLPK